MGTNYQPIQWNQPDITGNALDRMMQLARDQREKQRMMADLLLRRQQLAEQQRQAGVSEEMQRGEAERSQGYLDLQRQAADRLKTADERNESERVIKVRQQAEAAAAQGNYDLARQLMASIGASYDAPKRYTIGGDFQISGKRPQQPAGGPEMSVAPDAAAIKQGAQNVGAFLNGQAPLDSRFDAAMPRVLEQLGRGDAQPQRTAMVSDQAPGAGPMQFRRGGETITIDPDAVRARQAATAEAALQPVLAKYDAASQRLAKSLPGFEQYAEIGRAQLELGVPPEKALQDAFDLYKADQANQSRLDAAKLRKRGGRGGASGANRDTAVFDPNTGEFIGNARDATTARATGTMLGSLDEAISIADQLKGNYEQGIGLADIMADPAGAFGRFTDRTQLARSLTITAKEIAKLGALSGPDEAIINDVIGGRWTLWTGAGGAQRMQRFIDLAQRNRERLLNSAGVNRRQPNAMEQAGAKSAERNRQSAERIMNAGKTWDDAADELIGGL